MHGQSEEPDGVREEPMSPGDQARPGTPGTGEHLCKRCAGSGRVEGKTCPVCAGKGKVIVGVGGA